MQDYGVDFRAESLAGLAQQVRDGSIGAQELVDHALERIDKLDKAIGAFVAVDPQAARQAAQRIDRAVAAGEQVGPLAGVPIGVKDTEDAVGFPTTYGSAVLSTRYPRAASRDSILVARLKAAGCVVVGKTNAPELAWKPDTENRLFGRTANPWALERTAGGSSGGSAAAIAAGMVPLATGSDGGGSIRIPSSCCGLSGMKTSLGRVPCGGEDPPDWPGLSSSGPMALSMEDIAMALDHVVGPDQSDLWALPKPEPSWEDAVRSAGIPLRVAWSPTLGYGPTDREVQAICEAALAVLEEMGAEVETVESVFDRDPLATWLTLSGSYLWRTLEPHAGTKEWELVDPGLAAVVDRAAGLDGLAVVKALDDCHRLNLRLVSLFKKVRVLATPTCAAIPPIGGKPGKINGADDMNWVKFTYPFNLTRSPAATVTAGFSSGGLPVGIQLVGPQHGDQVVLRTAGALENALGLERIPRL